MNSFEKERSWRPLRGSTHVWCARDSGLDLWAQGMGNLYFQCTLLGIKATFLSQATVAHVFNPSPREAGAGGSDLQREFRDSQGCYPEKSCLKKLKKQNKTKATFLNSRYNMFLFYL